MHISCSWRTTRGELLCPRHHTAFDDCLKTKAKCRRITPFKDKPANSGLKKESCFASSLCSKSSHVRSVWCICSFFSKELLRKWNRKFNALVFVLCSDVSSQNSSWSFSLIAMYAKVTDTTDEEQIRGHSKMQWISHKDRNDIVITFYGHHFNLLSTSFITNRLLTVYLAAISNLLVIFSPIILWIFQFWEMFDFFQRVKIFRKKVTTLLDKKSEGVFFR